MRIGRKKSLLVSLLLVILLLGVLVLTGCIRGLQPIGWSGVTAADGTLFVGSKEGRLVSINTADSSLRWSEPMKAQASAGGFGCAPAYGGGCAGASTGVAIYGTPVVAGDLVYVGGYNGKLYAYNSSSLQMRWVYPREDYLQPIIGGPVVAINKVYFSSSDGNVYALDAPTGDRVWGPVETGDKIWSTPAIDGDTLFVSTFGKKLYALDAGDGSEKWQFDTEGAIAATPLVQDNTVYVGAFDRYLYAVDATDGSLKWKFMGGNWFWSRPVVYNGVVYAGCLDGKLYALRAEDGTRVTDFDLGSPISSSAVLVDASVIVAAEDGGVYRLDTTNNELRLLTSVESAISATFAVSNGVAYIHTPDLTVYPVNISTGASLATISLKKPGE